MVDEATYIRVCETFMPALYRVAMSILHRREDAQDAVQQALTNAWMARARARSGAEQAWLMRILINECRNIQRRRMRSLPVGETPDCPCEPANAELRETVESMPEKLRTPLLLKYMEGMSEKEVAAALGVTVSCAKSRLLRARRAFEKEWRGEL